MIASSGREFESPQLHQKKPTSSEVGFFIDTEEDYCFNFFLYQILREIFDYLKK